MKPWITTYGTHVVDIREPTVEQVRSVGLEGFGYALAHLNRFTGHAGAYSVAQHSINVARCVRYCLGRPDLELPALFHDAAEAVTGDVSTPMKAALDEEYEDAAWNFGPPATDLAPRACLRRITKRLDEVIDLAFGTDFTTICDEDRAIIKRADLIVLATERRAFFDTHPPDREASWLHGCGEEQPWASTTLADGRVVAPELHERDPRQVAAHWVLAAEIAGAR